MPSAEGATDAKPPPYTWVDTREAFDRTVAALRSSPRIAIDTEADSLYHYFEKVCLVQCSTADETFVIDPLALVDLAPLGPILGDPGVEKVFHASGYDLVCLHRDHGFSVRRLFDTHVAASLLGYEQLGLGSLLERLLGVAHSKRRQRDDWSRRPLEQAQLEYAAMDTHHLLELRDVLEAELDARGRLDWALEEFAFAATVSYNNREFDPEGFRRIKGHRGLALGELAILRALYLARDRWARQLDLPPFKVINNSVLIDLARRPPTTPGTLLRRPGISFRVARRYAEELVRVVDEARSQDPSFLVRPPRSPYQAPSREARVRLERLKTWRQVRAKELGLPVGVAFPGAALEEIAAQPPPDLGALEAIAGMRRWRARLFGPEIVEIVSSVG